MEDVSPWVQNLTAIWDAVGGVAAVLLGGLLGWVVQRWNSRQTMAQHRYQEKKEAYRAALEAMETLSQVVKRAERGEDPATLIEQFETAMRDMGSVSSDLELLAPDRVFEAFDRAMSTAFTLSGDAVERVPDAFQRSADGRPLEKLDLESKAFDVATIMVRKAMRKDLGY